MALHMVEVSYFNEILLFLTARLFFWRQMRTSRCAVRNLDFQVWRDVNGDVVLLLSLRGFFLSTQ